MLETALDAVGTAGRMAGLADDLLAIEVARARARARRGKTLPNGSGGRDKQYRSGLAFGLRPPTGTLTIPARATRRPARWPLVMQK